MPRTAASTVLILAILSLAACAGLVATPIKKILDNPKDYDGRTVTISGEVRDTANVLVFKTYTVKDETGEILVVTKGAVPKKGDTVRLTGVVEQAFALGDRRVVVIRESGDD